MYIEEADIIESHVLGSLEDGIIATSIYHKKEVLVPVLEDSCAVHYSRARRPSCKRADLPGLD